MSETKQAQAQLVATIHRPYIYVSIHPCRVLTLSVNQPLLRPSLRESEVHVLGR